MRFAIGSFLAVFVVACGGTTANTGTNVTDGGTTSSDGGTVVSCDPSCFGGDLSWGYNGGLVAYVDSSRINGCTNYVHSRSDSSGTGGGDLSCTATLDTCGSTIGAGNVAAALSASDVAAAFAAYDPSKGPKVYGSDSRPCDGALYEVTYQGKTIDIGGKCGEGCGGSQDACVEVTNGMRSLQSTLQQLDQQELKTPSCKSVFPDG